MINTIILPGGSPKNKVWADQISQQLQPLIPNQINYWEHWQTDPAGNVDITTELKKIEALIRNNQFNIVAKSIGTYIGLHVIKTHQGQVQKVILAGLPLHDLDQSQLAEYQVLNNLPIENILVLQNDADPHGSYLEAKEFLAKINPTISVVKKLGNNHEYLYTEDFQPFILSTNHTS